MAKKEHPFKDFFGQVRQDLKETNLRKSLMRDLREIYEFYLTPKELAELAAMGWFRRWIYRIFWFAKSIILKLTAFRRILVLLSLILLIDTENTQRVTGAYLILFLVLILELKDKLLAHDELNAGRAVQAALRPRECPNINGWDAYMYTRSANQVGGDLIDCTQVDDSVGFMIGDVAGKGLGAALLMAQLQAGVQALVSHFKSTPQLVTQLNRLYCRGGVTNRFISFLYMTVKSESDTVSFVNAGHLPPLIVRQNNIIEWQKGGTALGLNPAAEYQQDSVTLHMNEICVLYTDGITEARNEKGEFFGDTFFHETLLKAPRQSSESYAKHIIKIVDDFIGNATRSDDLTMLILKRSGA